MEQEQKILLHELTRLVRCIYPDSKVYNPYTSLLSTFSESMELSEQLLLIEVVESFALLHQHSRLQEPNQLAVYREDVLNGMQLFLPHTKRIDISTNRLHTQLREHFEDRLFTYHDICLLLDCGHSTAKRKLAPLQAMGLIETASIKRYGTKKLMRAVEHELLEEEPDTGVFDEAFAEWADFEGYLGGVERRG